MKIHFVAGTVALASLLFAVRSHSQDASDAAVDASGQAGSVVAGSNQGGSGQGGSGQGGSGQAGSVLAGSNQGGSGQGGSGQAGSVLAGSNQDGGPGGQAGMADGSGAAIATCVPGKVDTCACVGGLSGVQTCEPNGIFGSCECPDAGAGGTTGSAAPDAEDDSGCSCRMPGASASSNGSVALLGLGALAWLIRGRRRPQPLVSKKTAAAAHAASRQ